ncbi:MAG: hypothetical protein GY757_01530 [bacterium]|nr:hypothetical protein [bacterium]
MKRKRKNDYDSKQAAIRAFGDKQIKKTAQHPRKHLYPESRYPLSPGIRG